MILNNNPDDPPEPITWPTGCQDPNSCAKHKQCAYVNCTWSGRDIEDGIKAAGEAVNKATKISQTSGSEEYVTDPEREGENHGATGIYTRSVGKDGEFEAYDIAELSEDSLTAWLKSRGGDNPWAEQVVRILLGHEE